MTTVSTCSEQTTCSERIAARVYFDRMVRQRVSHGGIMSFVGDHHVVGGEFDGLFDQLFQLLWADSVVISNRSPYRLTISSVWVPIEPVEPRTANRCLLCVISVKGKTVSGFPSSSFKIV